jgi:hypothetical protein
LRKIGPTNSPEVAGRVGEPEAGRVPVAPEVWEEAEEEVDMADVRIARVRWAARGRMAPGRGEDADGWDRAREKRRVRPRGGGAIESGSLGNLES